VFCVELLDSCQLVGGVDEPRIEQAVECDAALCVGRHGESAEQRSGKE